MAASLKLIFSEVIHTHILPPGPFWPSLAMSIGTINLVDLSFL